ncbi:SDR family NAD(P)-dependent oxidoreductase [Methylobrevis albus]|uniref:SDR family oxidoreductase n=1 Tax=Methylobrevis albus TaxID=2793297 RepID=A0A931N0E6_9HYPH|nr:SDR family NAD(P)-dependent oxidoreductase [Methylobrevis albus]MBH0239109.1 SDR family oxidoreductase [Methylobrevis albus]
MAGLLDGKVALVTGAAQGIGLAVARAYVAEGAAVALADVQAGAVESAAAEIGGKVLPLVLDVTDAGATAAAVETVEAYLGPLDIVVPNAGILLLKHAVEMEAAEFRRVLDVNLTGAFITARAGAQRMLAHGRGGRIVFTSSLFGLRGGRENAAYSASKFGMIGVMQSMAAELAGAGILVNAVCPGQMDTAMIRQLFRDRAALRGVAEAEVRGALESRIPVGHLGPLEHLAGTYVYLASGLARYVTGQSITVDGGWQIG